MSSKNDYGVIKHSNTNFFTSNNKLIKNKISKIPHPQISSKKKLDSKSLNSQIFEDNWTLAAKQLLYPKYKYSYTDQELIRLKRLIIFSPPPLDIRRKVRKKNKNSIY